jgi:diguanylate cyclase (GGDEF)-like protein
MSGCGKTTAIPAQVKRILASCKNLPSLPSVVINIIKASKDPDISLADVADILHVDAALSAKLLKIANSSMYARRREITNLRDALALLGLDAALTIALSFSLVKSLNSSADANNNYNAFWKRSILSAIIARQIGLKLAQPHLEDFFLAGLLQDIGILALNCSTSNCLHDNYQPSHQDRIHNEKKSLGVDHADVSAWLLKSWGLPEKLYKAVLCSHTLYTTSAETHEEEIFYQCIVLSGNLADIWYEKDGKKTLERNLGLINNMLGFNRDEFNEFINEINDLLPEMSNLFDIKIIDDEKREEVINEARAILMKRSLNIIKQYNEHRDQIESLTKKTKHIEKEARRDHLTNIYNRKYMEKLLTREFDKSNLSNEPLSLAFIDIDNFKPINDTYGHLAGDKVIQETALFFITNIRQTDSLARYGGDEFLLLLPNTNADTAHNLLQRLIKKLQQSPGTEFNGERLKISTSIGVATHMDDVNFNSLEELISAADKALYNAKHAGKNTIMSYD